MRCSLLVFSIAALGVIVLPRSLFAAYEAPIPAAAPPPKEAFLEAAVRRAAAAVFLGDVKALQTLAVQTRQYEDAHAAELGGFRLSDSLAALAAGLAPTRAERLAQMESVAAAADPEVRALYARMRRDDPLLQADRLEWKRQWNRAAGVFNYFAQSATSLFTGNFNVLYKWAFDLALCWRPSTEMSAEARANAQNLDRRYLAQSAEDLLRLADLHREARRPDDALFYAEKASKLGADAGDATLKASHEQSQVRRELAKTMDGQGPGEANADPKEAKELREMLEALAVGDAATLADKSKAFAAAHPASPFRDEAVHLQSVAAQWKKNRAGAEKLRESLAEAADDSNMALHARNERSSPEANPQAAYERAKAQGQRDTWRYIWLGYSPAEERLRKAMDGDYEEHGFLDYVDAALLVNGVIRAIKVAFGGGPENAALRAAAADWIRKDPDGPQAKELAAWLAGEAERSGDYKQALSYYKQAGADSAAVRGALRQKEARDAYVKASEVENPAQREALLEKASQELSDTKYGAKASEKALEAAKKQRIVLGKSDLYAIPALWNGRGLRWPAAWFDGDPGNGELADDGVAFNPPDQREVEFTLIQGAERVPQRLPLTGRPYDEVQAALRENRLLAERREAADDYDRRRLLPLELQGSAGAGGIMVYPSLLPYEMEAKEQELYH
ncbi:MAG: hypothetical protein NTW86_20495 [Candidatus Sumerlaeota bacterium]|nr:hypothetical protein [Candidatus Sumerlaeota bacterium]